MLLTLAVSSLASKLKKKGSPGSGGLDLRDVPRYARETLGLYGLNLHTSLLAGADAAKLDAIREAADKAACPCLVLIESDPQPLGDMDEDRGSAAVERLMRVYKAANRLGCNSVAVTIDAPDDEDALDAAAERGRQLLAFGERQEINLLIASSKGLTEKADRLTELIKRIGGFRIGTFPDFLTAAKAADPLLFLRRVTPYASALTVSTQAFKAPKKPGGPAAHEAYDIDAFAKVVSAVGYSGTLAIDYRGAGDPEEGIRLTKQALESSLGAEVGGRDLDEDDDELGLEDVEEGEEAEGEEDDGEEE